MVNSAEGKQKFIFTLKDREKKMKIYSYHW
jgi:hypothetical protein